MSTEAVILDIDQTIYKNRYLAHAYDEAMVNLIAKKYDMDFAEARESLENKKKYIYMIEGLSSTTKALLASGITIDEWIDFSCSQVDPRDYLAGDKGVIRTVKWLCKNFKIAVISNNNSIQLFRTYEAIGVEGYLSDVTTLSISNTKILKPNISLFGMALSRINVVAPNALSVGDREEIDLAPARLLGMLTYKIDKMEDFYTLDSNIKASV